MLPWPTKPRPAARKAARGVAARLLGCLGAAFLFAAGAQITPAQTTLGQTGPVMGRGATASAVIYVVNQDNRPVSEPATITVALKMDTSSAQVANSENGSAHFSRLLPGTYEVLARLTGMKDGTAEFKVGDYDAVLITVTLEPINDSPPVPIGKQTVLTPKAQKALDQGLAAMRAGNYEAARPFLDEAYKLAPTDPEVNDAMGELLMFTKDFDQANEFLGRAAALNPRYLNAELDLGQLRVQQRDYSGAATVLEKAVEIAPENSFAHWLLGICYLDLHEAEKARQEAVLAIKFGKGTLMAAEYLLGQSLATLGRKPEAIQALQNFINDAPKDPSVPRAQALIARLQSPPAPPQIDPGSSPSAPPSPAPARRESSDAPALTP